MGKPGRIGWDRSDETTLVVCNVCGHRELLLHADKTQELAAARSHQRDKHTGDKQMRNTLAQAHKRHTRGR
jgi:hypothetical protein